MTITSQQPIAGACEGTVWQKGGKDQWSEAETTKQKTSQKRDESLNSVETVRDFDTSKKQNPSLKQTAQFLNLILTDTGHPIFKLATSYPPGN